MLVRGVAYKKDVDALRESPTLKIMQLLLQHGAQLDYNDRTSRNCTRCDTPISKI